MALVNCSECGKEISDKAEACPNCGAPMKWTSEFIGRPGSLSRLANIGCLTLVVGVAVFSLIIYLSG